MHINVEHGDNFATLHLRGEFDTYYCKHLQEQIEALAKGGVTRAILNLRLVRFINSTALGAIIKASKTLTSRGGKMVIARPSKFCREIIEKVGVDRVVPIFDDEQEAARAVLSDAKVTPKPAATGPVDDESTVLFSPTDPARIEHFLTQTQRYKGVVSPMPANFGAQWNGYARMAGVDKRGLRFTWNGGDTGLDVFAMGQLLSIGTELKVKFRLPLFKTGHCEALAVVSEVEEREGGIKIGAAFTKIDKDALAAVSQYETDLKFLKDELKKATS